VVNPINIKNCHKYATTGNETELICIFISSICFDLTLDHHQALQFVQNIKGKQKISLSEFISQFTFHHVALQVWLHKNRVVTTVKIGCIGMVSMMVKWAIQKVISLLCGVSRTSCKYWYVIK